MNDSLRYTQIDVNTICVPRFAYHADDIDNAQMPDNEIDREKVGAAIKRIRLAKKLNQADLADAADTDTGNISRLERGLQGWTDTTLNAIAGRLGVTAGDIYRLAEQNEKDSNEPETTPQEINGKSEFELPPIREAPIVGKLVRNEDGVVMIKEINLGSKKVYTRDIEARCYQEDTAGYEPRIRVNEIIVVEPNSQIKTEKDVLIQFIDGHCAVRQYISEDDQYYRVNDVNYQGVRERILKSEVESIERIGGYYQAD